MSLIHFSVKFPLRDLIYFWYGFKKLRNETRTYFSQNQNNISNPATPPIITTEITINITTIGITST